MDEDVGKQSLYATSGTREAGPPGALSMQGRPATTRRTARARGVASGIVSGITPRLRGWNWRLIGILFVGLFLVGFVFGEGDWLGLQDNGGFWPELALRATRGLASAILAPVTLGLLSGISHLFHIVPLRAARRTWPAVPKERYEPGMTPSSPDEDANAGGGWVRRWVVGIILFAAPIYLVWGVLRLMGVDSDEAATSGVTVTIALWLAVALIRALSGGPRP